MHSHSVLLISSYALHSSSTSFSSSTCSSPSAWQSGHPSGHTLWPQSSTRHYTPHRVFSALYSNSPTDAGWEGPTPLEKFMGSSCCAAGSGRGPLTNEDKPLQPWPCSHGPLLPFDNGLLPGGVLLPARKPRDEALITVQARRFHAFRCSSAVECWDVSGSTRHTSGLRQPGPAPSHTLYVWAAPSLESSRHQPSRRPQHTAACMLHKCATHTTVHRCCSSCQLTAQQYGARGSPVHTDQASQPSHHDSTAHTRYHAGPGLAGVGVCRSPAPSQPPGCGGGGGRDHPALTPWSHLNPHTCTYAAAASTRLAHSCLPNCMPATPPATLPACLLSCALRMPRMSLWKP